MIDRHQTVFRLTEHARVRMQQRAIPHAAVEALLAYGKGVHDHHGATVFYFDKAARRRLRCARLDRALEHQLDAFAVVGAGGEIVTVGHRLRRIRQH